MTSPKPVRVHHAGWQSRAHRAEILSAPEQHHPTVVAFAKKHAANVQLVVADGITAFAGSMKFVYLHVLIFGVWCATGLFGLDKFPFQFLTMAVSLEAIFLSTFVMIGQNRQSAFQQEKADHEFTVQEKELDENTVLTREIHRLTVELHKMQTPPAASSK
jgi:uncharacterized membrane protein